MMTIFYGWQKFFSILGAEHTLSVLFSLRPLSALGREQATESSEFARSFPLVWPSFGFRIITPLTASILYTSLKFDDFD